MDGGPDERITDGGLVVAPAGASRAVQAGACVGAVGQAVELKLAWHRPFEGLTFNASFDLARLPLHAVEVAPCRCTGDPPAAADTHDGLFERHLGSDGCWCSLGEGRCGWWMSCPRGTAAVSEHHHHRDHQEADGGGDACAARSYRSHPIAR